MDRICVASYTTSVFAKSTLVAIEAYTPNLVQLYRFYVQRLRLLDLNSILVITYVVK